ncbi:MULTISPECIES: thymidine kinase [Hymenobacter]|uniref:Thymidine kinase n=1 Tax=Hymenobacter yonginensis TaxID=748197 RepID=A0ABY7PPJ8_9BACT|nr:MULTISPECIES: thymidine kinase [Hymenobacter]AII51427.1 thymidine kinase [Hymenobacter sp. APR13]WBO84676.1 thymidine kinase [Hymenobacter yonginensis]
MFIEPRVGNGRDAARRGWIEVVCGSMFSGKTEELIRRLNRAKIARQHVEIFKPALDTRYHQEDVVSHNANSIRSTPVPVAQEILLLAGGCDVVGIDEAQFFDDSLVDVCVQLANRGSRVIVAGLDMDFLGKPFGPMPALMAVAEYVTKVHAVCVCCGEIASYSFRMAASEDKILLGETDVYEARCRPCFLDGMQDKALHETSTTHKH